MIDVEKRRRILELWEAGYTKKAIASMVKVSVPSVRKYIRESEAVRTSDLKQGNTVPIVVRDVSFPPGTRFIVNLGLPFPYSNNDPWTCLNNGVPIFDLKNVLGKVMAPRVVGKIVEEITRLGGARAPLESSHSI